MSWLGTLLSWWASFSNTAALWAYYSTGWVWPLNQLQGFFSSLSSITNGLYGAFFDFYYWVLGLENRISEIFTWRSIIDSLQYALNGLQSLIAWFNNWWGNVFNVVDYYWSVVSSQVHDWISTATQGLSGMLSAWNNFVTVILPGLFNLQYAESWWQSKLVGLGDLINSAFVARADLWSGWTTFRQQVSDFFTDPLEWLWTRFMDWFLGRE